MSDKESHGHGLRPEDVDLIFPDSVEESQKSEPVSSVEDMQYAYPSISAISPISVIDYKKRASGERDDLEPAGDEDAQAKNPEIDPTVSIFEGEPWPEPPEETPKLQKEAIKTKHKRLEPLPSDRSWFAELKRILRS